MVYVAIMNNVSSANFINVYSYFTLPSGSSLCQNLNLVLCHWPKNIISFLSTQEEEWSRGKGNVVVVGGIEMPFTNPYSQH